MNQKQLFESAYQKIEKYIAGNSSDENLVVQAKTPSELGNIIDFAIPEDGVAEDVFNDLMEKYLQYSVRTGHSQFFNQLYSGFNLPAFLGEVLTALTNTSMYTYEVAPVATMIEKEMISLMNGYVGYEAGDGLFVTGGSNGNMIAMFSARNRMFPDARFEGLEAGLKLTAFVSEHAHYSFETAANLLGIGSNAVIKVKADKNGRMIPDALQSSLEESKARGEVPFFVAATCGTTLTGSYDPIEAIVELAKPYNIWVHADGSFGGSIVLSDEHRHIIAGLEKTDSFAWNPHKLMNIPLVCSTLLVKDKNSLHQNLTDINADYLYHGDDSAEDLGKKSIQCGRRVDAVKLWFAWKYYGLEGYQKRVKNLLNLSEYAESLIQSNPNLEMFIDRQSFALCFRYIPDQETDLDSFNLKLRDELNLSGLAMVNYGFHKNALVLRLVITNGEQDESDVDQFFSSLTTIAQKLTVPVLGY